jgi:hypothetical protein
MSGWSMLLKSCAQRRIMILQLYKRAFTQSEVIDCLKRMDIAPQQFQSCWWWLHVGPLSVL